MIDTGAMDRLLSAGNLFDYQGDPVADARQARRMLDTFERVNTTISDPEKAKRPLSEVMAESVRVNREALSEALRRQGKGTRVDTLV